MFLRVSVAADEIPAGVDPVIDLVPLIEAAGWTLVLNGVRGPIEELPIPAVRFLLFERRD